MLRRLLPALTVGAALFALPATALEGDCSSLSVSSATEGKTTTWTIDVTGSIADTLVFAAVGETAGETVFDLGALGSATICLAQPFILAPIGLTDANGDASLSFAVPAGDPLGIELLAQAAAFEFSLDLTTVPPTFGLDSCTSNVEALSL